MNDFLSKRAASWFIAELLGTFFLAVTVGTVLAGVELYPSVYQALYLPFLAGLVIAVLVYLLGPISGGHFNPAVSLALWVVRKLPSHQAIIHIVAQVVGAYAGLTVVRLLIGSTPDLPFNTAQAALLGEFIGTFLLVFAVSQVVYGRVPAEMSGMVIGLALTIGLTISLLPSGGILNPALSLSWGAYHIPYLVAPFLGGIVAAGLSKWLSES